MERLIEYRGKINGEWKAVTPDNTYLWSKFWAIVDRKTVGQYTGHMDKNSTPVWEDDILKDRWGILWKVQWNVEKAQFQLAWAGGPQPEYYVFGMYLIKDCQCEVVSNIHDTPLQGQ
jgi:hypothetical protein